MKTWHFEWAVVAAILVAVNVATRATAIAWVGAAAVLLSFGHASVADRLAERQRQLHFSARTDGELVHCYRWLARYLLAKETLWVVYFLATRSYPALVGCGVFLMLPIWRRLYRRWRSLGRGAATDVERWRRALDDMARAMVDTDPWNQ